MQQKKWFKSSQFLFLILFGFNFALMSAQAVSQEEAEIVPGEILVKFSDSVELSEQKGVKEMEQIAQENGLKKEAMVAEENLATLKVENSKEKIVEKIEQLSSDPRVEYAQPNFVYHAFNITSNDPNRDLQWALDNFGQDVQGTTGTVGADIEAKEAWGISEGGENQVIVAVLDDGAFYTHNDLVANMWDGSSCADENGNFLGGCQHGFDFLYDDKDPLPEAVDTHGTMVAGILGAGKNNGYGGMGVAPHVKIMALRLGSGKSFTTDKIIRAIGFAKKNGAKIINASWGGPNADLALKAAIENFDGLFVTSAGNEAKNNEIVPVYPCSFDSPNIVCAAATDQNDFLWGSSNFGNKSVDLGAPGVKILAPANTGIDAYVLASGTSMAAPMVSGVAALLWGRENSLTFAQVKERILNGGDSLSSLANVTLSGKRLNAFGALGGKGLVLESSDPFAGINVRFKDEEVKKGKTKKEKVKLKFENVSESMQFMFSRRADFAGATWQTIQDGVRISLKEKGKAETFYVKFRNSNGTESRVFKNKVQREKTGKSIKNSRKTIKVGATLTQRGKGFSKRSNVELHFGEKSMLVKTDAKGAFQISYKVNKMPGNYSWYAVDLKTGKKTRSLTYKVVR